MPDVKFFNMAEFTIAGKRVRGLRHGMAGQPGFELFGPWEDGDAVLEAVLRAGEKHGLVRVGVEGVLDGEPRVRVGAGPHDRACSPTTRSCRSTGSGSPSRRWVPSAAASTRRTSRDYYLTPYDIGYGKTVKFDHEFVGREALERLAQTPPPRTKVTLVWNADDVTAAIGSLYRPGPGAKYIDMPKARYATHHEDKVLKDGQQVGISLDCGYLANEREMVSLATIDTALSEPGTEVVVLWGEQPVSAKPAVEEHVQVEIRATVAPCPYDARDTYRSR